MDANMLARLLRPIWRKLRLIVAKGVINLVNDGLKVQGMQVTLFNDETASSLQRFQEYGFTSVPLQGAEAIGVAVGGIRGNVVIVATDDGRYRLKNLAPGEVALYTNEGAFIHFKNGGEIDMETGNLVKVTAPDVTVVATTKVTLQTPLVECTQALKVDGNLEVDGTSDLKGAVTAELSVTSPTITGTTDVIVGPAAKSMVGHKHTGVTVGAGNTGGML